MRVGWRGSVTGVGADRAVPRKVLSGLVLTGTSDLVDTRLLGYERFAEGRLLEETAVL